MYEDPLRDNLNDCYENIKAEYKLSMFQFSIVYDQIINSLTSIFEICDTPQNRDQIKALLEKILDETQSVVDYRKNDYIMLVKMAQISDDTNLHVMANDLLTLKKMCEGSQQVASAYQRHFSDPAPLKRLTRECLKIVKDKSDSIYRDSQKNNTIKKP